MKTLADRQAAAIAAKLDPEPGPAELAFVGLGFLWLAGWLWWARWWRWV